MTDEINRIVPMTENDAPLTYYFAEGENDARPGVRILSVRLYNRELSDEEINRFIVTKPDPLVEALCEMDPDTMPNEADADNLRAAIEKRGGKIVWGEG